MIRDAFLHGSAACLGELLVRPLDRPLEHPCPYVVAVTRRAVPGREDEVVRLAVIRARLVRLQLVEQGQGRGQITPFKDLAPKSPVMVESARSRGDERAIRRAASREEPAGCWRPYGLASAPPALPLIDAGVRLFVVGTGPALPASCELFSPALRANFANHE